MKIAIDQFARVPRRFGGGRLRFVRRGGLTLIEAMLAVTIMTVTGSALLSSAMSAIQSGSVMSQTLIAEGIADQLMEEVLLVGFPRGTNTLPASGHPRIVFNHVDDFANYNRRPPVDRFNRTLGTEDGSGTRNVALQPIAGYLDGYRQQIFVEPVSLGVSGYTTVTTDTDYRRLTVQVNYVDAAGAEVTLAKRVRILSRVAFTP